MPPTIPITLLTGFTGSGKTTLLLSLLPQLRSRNPGYTLSMIKNDIGDLSVDSQLAQAAELTASKELLGDCICCTNVGQIESALTELADRGTDRIVIETSGSAEPLKLVLEIKRVSRGRFEVDGVVSVVDAENWSGYASTSYTARLQAQQTDLIIINKWESLSERDYDTFLDKLGDLDVDTPQVKSDKGWIDVDLLFGFDSKMAHATLDAHSSHEHNHDHGEKHTSEIECLSVTIPSKTGSLDLDKLTSGLLKVAPKDEVYRIKAVTFSESTPVNSEGSALQDVQTGKRNRFILNWSFGRWTWALADEKGNGSEEPVLRMSIFTAPYESNKWTKKAESGGFLVVDGGGGIVEVKRVQ